MGVMIKSKKTAPEEDPQEPETPQAVEKESPPPSGFSGKGTASTQHPTGATIEAQYETPGAPPPAQGHGPPMSYPSIRLGQTLNLGNYNSLRIEVGLSVPCLPEDLDETYEYAFGWVDERFSKLLDDAKSAYQLKD